MEIKYFTCNGCNGTGVHYKTGTTEPLPCIICHGSGKITEAKLRKQKMRSSWIKDIHEAKKSLINPQGVDLYKLNDRQITVIKYALGRFEKAFFDGECSDGLVIALGHALYMNRQAGFENNEDEVAYQKAFANEASVRG